jgi:hypothetical protein
MDIDELTHPIDDCGTLDAAAPQLAPAIIETMKIVFRETHGGEMTLEDREFLGISDS